jgi:hypothetical protein
MPVQIGLSNGEKWVVEGDLDATVNAMSGPGDMYTALVELALLGDRLGLRAVGS